MPPAGLRSAPPALDVWDLKGGEVFKEEGAP